MNEEYVRLGNAVKVTLLEALEREGLLADGTSAKEISGDYAIIIMKKGLFGKVWDKLRGYNDETKTFWKVIKDV